VRCDSKFEVLGSKFRKPRTSDLEPLDLSPVAFFSPVQPVPRRGGLGSRPNEAFQRNVEFAVEAANHLQR
jgi:hypothetical protein